MNRQQARRAWLVSAYAADVRIVEAHWKPSMGDPPTTRYYPNTPQDVAAWITDVELEDHAVLDRVDTLPACRCFRCGRVLAEDEIVPDQINPRRGWRRDNIRPSCGRCEPARAGGTA